MKFAQYLQDTQIPEWKKAYIDYRGLKKQIGAIRSRPRKGQNLTEPSSALSVSNTTNNTSIEPRPEEEPSLDLPNAPASAPADVLLEGTNKAASRSRTLRRRTSARDPRPSSIRQGISGIKRAGNHSISSRFRGTSSRPTDPMTLLPLGELLPQLLPREVAFFNALDEQLEKVESFYVAREKELSLRTQLLQRQLSELRDHEKLVHEATGHSLSWTSAITTALKLKLRPHGATQYSGSHTSKNESLSPTSRSSTVNNQSAPIHPIPSHATDIAPNNDQEKHESSNVRECNGGSRDIPLSSDPDDYLYARKKLKKAVLEHYRGMELLQNYRILNITGFRKALKKFDKMTKIRAQEQYMTEKVDRSAFASDRTLQTMMKDMQVLYAREFLDGDMRRTMNRLRGHTRRKTHHFSTFCSGFMIGLAIPALVLGVYNSFLRKTREGIHAWDALLYIYGIIFIPVLFSLLVGTNLVVWARYRINYVFIFELDTRTRLDYREYFETPGFLFMTLCYAFWLSFARVGSSHISPTTWPLIWLGLMATILLNPLSFLSRPSRYWLIKHVGKLFVSGNRRVEFTDFWMGDQFCSLMFTLSNLYTFACVYTQGFPDNWNACRVSSNLWPISFVLATVPFFIRVVQSIKRYIDSKLITHLINGGKYGTGIVAYFFYVLWRHQGMHHNSMFALFCLCNTCYSVYATGWDLLMDWSLFRPHAKHRFLRDELGYSHNVYFYYIAIVTNTLIRFGWVFYIPQRGPNMLVRTFIVAVLEMLRRVQWNFYRLENEHLGNMDQYRVTREVPLPYAFDEIHEYDDDDDSRSRTRGKQSG